MAVRTEQVQAGLMKEVLQEGSGDPVKRNDRVTVHCTGFLKHNPDPSLHEPKKFWR